MSKSNEISEKDQINIMEKKKENDARNPNLCIELKCLHPWMTQESVVLHKDVFLLPEVPCL